VSEPRLRRGVITKFDEHAGLGTVDAAEGETYLFHCTQISDGTRTIAVGTEVTFELVDRHKGPEAYSVTAALG